MENIDLQTASALLKAGNIGVIPTDTLYGLVASVTHKEAVERVYKVKGRDKEKPSIILVPNSDILKEFGISEENIKMAEKFWPGPVSIILPSKSKKWDYLHRGTDSLAFRVPDDAELLKMLLQTGPLIAPSANLQGNPPARNIKEAKAYFTDKVDFYVDGGHLNKPPSTLISFLEQEFKILRHSVEDVETYAKFLKVRATKGVGRQIGGFLDFIREKGVIGLATGIIIGTAITTLVKALVDQIINPLVGLLVNADTLSTATFNIGSAIIGWGAFVNALINFLIIAAVVYFGFKLLKLDKLDKLDKKK
jgi:L-threonylcarbamoyladenylate synthase